MFSFTLFSSLLLFAPLFFSSFFSSLLSHDLPPLLLDICSSPDIISLLKDEVEAEGEYLAFRINIVDLENENENEDDEDENVLAQGSVALWVMIEDSCSILRQVSVSFSAVALFSIILSVRHFYPFRESGHCFGLDEFLLKLDYLQ